MDISKQYIKMSEKAKEIQKIWSPRAGDWFIPDVKMNVRIYGGSINIINAEDWIHYGTYVWLPRQDQLQEMLPKFGIGALINDIYEYGILNKNCENYLSLEQLWLAFIMQKRFQKVWSETEETWLDIK